jgi:hypothetical protein
MSPSSKNTLLGVSSRGRIYIGYSLLCVCFDMLILCFECFCLLSCFLYRPMWAHIWAHGPGTTGGREGRTKALYPSLARNRLKFGTYVKPKRCIWGGTWPCIFRYPGIDIYIVQEQTELSGLVLLARSKHVSRFGQHLIPGCCWFSLISGSPRSYFAVHSFVWWLSNDFLIVNWT